MHLPPFILLVNKCQDLFDVRGRLSLGDAYHSRPYSISGNSICANKPKAQFQLNFISAEEFQYVICCNQQQAEVLGGSHTKLFLRQKSTGHIWENQRKRAAGNWSYANELGCSHSLITLETFIFCLLKDLNKQNLYYPILGPDA